MKRKYHDSMVKDVVKKADDLIYYSPHKKLGHFQCHCGRMFHSAHELSTHYSSAHGGRKRGSFY